MDAIICEKCNSIAYYDNYFGRYVCSSCRKSYEKNREPTTNDKVYCRWCGREMHLCVEHYYTCDGAGRFYKAQYQCGCGACGCDEHSGFATEQEACDDALKAALYRWQKPNRPMTIENRPLTMDEFKDGPPTVAWIELREADCDMLAAVFTAEGLYEVQNGMPWEDCEYDFQGLDYGIGFRVWSGLFHGKPTAAERAAAPWKEATNER